MEKNNNLMIELNYINIESIVSIFNQKIFNILIDFIYSRKSTIFA